MRRLALLLALAACTPQATDTPRIVPKSACGVPCTTTSQCDSIGNCRVCGVTGKCGVGLPAEPLSDAATGISPDDTATENTANDDAVHLPPSKP